MVDVKVIPLIEMNFAQRLVALRKARTLTQQALAKRVDIHVSNIRRYEAGTSAPTLDGLRNLALALNTGADSLLLDPDQPGPTDPSLRLRLEAVKQLDPDEQAVIRALIEGALLRLQARQLAVS
jgi:transcriptional regulator with XRE-family HTH domain